MFCGWKTISYIYFFHFSGKEIFFQRPSLRSDTFENYEVHNVSPNKKALGGGLKAAFQTRLTNQSNEPHFDTDSHYSVNGLARERQGANLVEYPRQYHSQSQYEEYPTSGLKAAFQTRIQPIENLYEQHTGLRGVFLTHQQGTPSGTPMTMADNVSDSTSDLSEHHAYPEHYDRFGHQDIPHNENQDTDYQEDQESLEDDYHTGHHSIHRLSHLNNKQGGSNLKMAFEARTGGTIRRNLGRNSQKDVLLEKHANLIVSKMEQDEALMEDSPDAEELRRTALRDMPQCLTIKRCVKVKLSRSVSHKSKRKPLSCWKMFKYRFSMGFTKLKINIRDLAYSFELWYEPLKKIEGTFGTGVASFFKFLRWLFLVNLIIAIFSTCFIVIPKVTYGTSIRQSTGGNILNDLVTGEGLLTDTTMYFGFYTNESISSTSLPYSMPHAYFFSMMSIYLICFAVIGTSAAKSYKRSFIETEGGLKNVFANKIFCGWDYNIATKDAADLKTKAIYNEIKELISDFTNKRLKTTFYQKFLIVVTQIFMNVLVLCMIAGTAFATWYFLNNVPTDRNKKIIIAPIFINTVMTFLPMLMSYMIKYEDYKSPKVSLYVTLFRTFLLGAVTIGCLVAYWVQNNSSSCWETSLAQEFYRMIVFDFFISVVCTGLLDVCLYIIYKYFRHDTYLEFDIGWNTMQIIYNQTLFWMGLVFSPLLPVVVVIKLCLCWYIRLGIVLILCKPSTKSWRAAQTSTWFLVMTFLSMMFVGAAVGYIISYIPASKGCGPFTNYEFIYQILTDGVLQLKQNSNVWQIVLYVTKPGVIAIILLFLCAKVYYSRAQANAQKEIVEQCRNMLVWSAKDKEYYYTLISQATKGQWQYKFHDKTVNPELYDPDLNLGNVGEDVRGAAPVPSASAMSYFEMDTDNNQYSRQKKYI